MNSDKLMKLMELIDEHKETLGDGDYLNACNLLKDINSDQNNIAPRDPINEAIRTLGTEPIRGGVRGLNYLPNGFLSFDQFRVSIAGFEPIVDINHNEDCTPRCRRHKPNIKHEFRVMEISMFAEDIRRADLNLRVKGAWDSSTATYYVKEQLEERSNPDAPHARIKGKSFIITDIQILPQYHV